MKETKLKLGENLLWQSFDHPSDTFMPGMKLSLNRRTGEAVRLTSWADVDDPRPGMFSLGLDPKWRQQFFIWRLEDPYWRSTVYGDSLSYGRYNHAQGYSTFLSFIFDGDKQYLTYQVSEKSIKLRATLTPNGKAKVLLWRVNSWFPVMEVPLDVCDFYGHCGPFGSCERGSSPLFCKCLTGFEPKIKEEWDTGNCTGGCHRQKALGCDNGDRFLKFERMKLPDNPVSFGNVGNVSMSTCESECLRNCSCTAYAYIGWDNRTPPECLNWFGDLIDIIHNDVNGQDLYVRLNRSELVANGDTNSFVHQNKWSLAIPLATASIGVLLTGIFSYYFCKKRQAKRGRTEGSLHESTSSISRIAGDGKNDIELLSLSFRSILAATDNFSESNKLGEGGFGPVYKGNLLKDQEVAIKRLSKKSVQGLQEFMNELKLIAKLQHTNLVRLLGCCVEEEEKILIYEYLQNRSLDKFLFDPCKQANLDWSKRFRIIEGIAQGLLYLHKYSRLRVIHRDLKASNILLDGAMNPKISDFGMARIFGLNQTEANTRRVVGTFGYMSPEYALYGKFSEKSDVYSFGVLLLEIVSGKRNTGFHHTGLSSTLLGWAWEAWKEGGGFELVDPSIRDSCCHHEVVKCVQLGLLCVQEAPIDRPTMATAVLLLSNETASLPLPKEPAFSGCRKLSACCASQSCGSYSNNEMTMSMPEAR